MKSTCKSKLFILQYPKFLRISETFDRYYRENYYDLEEIKIMLFGIVDLLNYYYIH